jgi:WD repeat-containing protein 70
MEVTGVAWHPSSKTTVLSSSLDGTLRVWDLEGEAAFGKLVNKHVLKLKGKTAARIGATCCSYAPDGSRLAAGGADGSVQVWLSKKVFSSRPDLTFKSTTAHGENVTITSVVFSPDGSALASRGTDGKIVLWSIKPLGSASGVTGNHQSTPLKVIAEAVNMYPQANVEFSPDGSMVCCGTSSERVRVKKPDTAESNSSSSGASSSSLSSGMDESKCYLLFFDVQGSAVEPVMRISVVGVGSVIHVKWAANTNQLLCSTANGFTRIFYDPRFSRKGVLLAASKAPKREKDPTDYAIVGEIHNPHALPMYRKDNSHTKRAVERRADAKAHAPERQLSTGPLKAPNNSFFFTQFVMQGKVKDSKRSEDPREALLKYNDMTDKDPMFLGRAYEGTQPKTLMAEQTYEEEEESFRKRQKLD